MTQEEVSQLMFSAKTLPQCATAWEARGIYLREHPDDERIIEEGESLYMMEQSLKHPFVENIIELHARLVGGQLHFEPSSELQVHHNEILLGEKRIVVTLSL